MFGHMLLGIFPYISQQKYAFFLWNRYLQSIGSCCMAIDHMVVFQNGGTPEITRTASHGEAARF